MKQISVQDLKASLSAVISQAEGGETIIITRHNAPVARLIPARSPYIHRGRNVGRGGIRPAIAPGKKIPYLDALIEDRGNR